MKIIHHLLLSLTAASLLAACSKADTYDSFGGYEEPSDQVENYMTFIADQLVAQNLQELETALSAAQDGGLGRYFYRTNGKNLNEDGAVWTVTREGVLYGLVISKVSGQQSWSLSFNGDFTFDYVDRYQTKYTLQASAADASTSAHRSWNVTLNGERHEQEDFWCTFASDGAIQYRSLSEDKHWNAYGYLLMTVFDGKKQIDKVVMQLKGGKSDSVIAHIE